MTCAPRSRHIRHIRRSRAQAQRRYRANYNAGTIAPHIPLVRRVQEALVRRARSAGLLTAEDAERVSRDWLARQAAEVLDLFADEWLEK